MGLLDDAIREHLELKRRHGADPDEVSRQEREALGAPATRGEFAQPGGATAEDAGADAPVAEADEPAAPEAEGAISEVEAELEEPPELAGAPDEAPPVEPEPGGYEEEPWLADEPDPEPDPEAAAAPPDDLVRPGVEPPSGDDVLEETPEFLQETPEHDRLWFEQKPPRDFDWDK